MNLEGTLGNFAANLDLWNFFADKEESFDDINLVKPESDFTPGRHRDPILDTYIDYLSNCPLEELAKESKNSEFNLNKDEWNAIMELKKDESLIIKESDKGGAWFIMDREFYNQKNGEYCNYRNTYQELEKNIDNEIFNKIVKLDTEHEDVLTDKEIKYLTHFNHQPSQLYGLPKIHKSEQIQKTVQENPSKYVDVQQPDDLPMRPIVAGPNCVTSRLSNLLDVLLKPFLKHVKSYVRDDIDFLNKVPKNITESKVLLTLDVTNMYTNIDNNLGREPIEVWLDNHPECIPRNISKDFILKALNIVLEFNTFTFNDRTFLQIRGVSMGTNAHQHM